MIKPVIKWSGSKRNQVNELLKYIPDKYNTYYEPFIGGGSMLYAVSPDKAICGDICEPLIELWERIKNNPKELADEYKKRWDELQKYGQEIYYNVRDSFNSTKNPDDLLFLTRTCFNGVIRFNSDGDFNNAFHHNRPGIRPDKLELIINDWSSRIRNVEFISGDYKNTSESAACGDFIYLDPPYFHTKGMYYDTRTINFEDFFKYLESLNKRGVKYMLSFDGKREDKDFTCDLPEELYKHHVYIMSGKSSLNRIVNRTSKKVYDSLYINY